MQTSSCTPIARHRLATIGVLFASFLAYSFVRVPVPAVNEPHYLTKAKHLWNPAWSPGDLFLESSNPHFVFYAVIGGLTRVCTLEQTAVIGRTAALLLLAVGFESLISTALRRRSALIGATWLYLGLAASGNLSGEWIVGGIEGKVLAYGFAFWGAGLAAQSYSNRAAVCLGLAISFHPVVGIWCTAATLFAIAVPNVVSKSWKQLRAELIPALQTILPPAVCLLLCALPGLIPAFQMLGGAPPEIIEQAENLQVFSRLRHHLDPTAFSATAYACYAALFLGWFLLRHYASLVEQTRFLHGYLIGSSFIAAGGLFAGLILKSPALMKFYPFRLFDVLLPLAVAVAVIGFLQQRATSENEKGGRMRVVLGWLLSSCALMFALSVPPVDRSPSRMHPQILADWIDCCRWIAKNTPPDSRVLTPSYGWAFKWYGERAEFVNYKDCPQDARSLLEWNRRYHELQNWERSHRADSLSRSVLRQFADHDNIDFVIAWPNDKTDLPVAYRNRYFAVFQAEQ